MLTRIHFVERNQMKTARWLILAAPIVMFCMLTIAPAAEIRIVNSSQDQIYAVVAYGWTRGVDWHQASATELAGFWTIAPGTTQALFREDGGTVTGVWLHVHSLKAEWNPPDRQKFIVQPGYVIRETNGSFWLNPAALRQSCQKRCRRGCVSRRDARHRRATQRFCGNPTELVSSGAIPAAGRRRNER